MGVVLRGLEEELVAVGQVVFGTRSGGGERWFDALGMGQFEGAIDFVGTDVVEALIFILLRQALPVKLCGLEEGEGAHHVRLGEGEGILDATIDMALGCEVDDTIDLLVLHKLVERVEVADVHLHKLVIGFVLDVLEVGQVAGVHVILGVLVHEQAHHVASNKACATSNNDCSFHIL